MTCVSVGYVVSIEARAAYLRRFGRAQALDRVLRVFRARLRVGRLGAYGASELREIALRVDRAACRAETLALVLRRRNRLARGLR